jgi:hypothetical protein
LSFYTLLKGISTDVLIDDKLYLIIFTCGGLLFNDLTQGNFEFNFYRQQFDVNRVLYVEN